VEQGVSNSTPAPTGWFNDGVITFTSGAGNGVAMDMKTSVVDPSTGLWTFVLQEALTFVMEPGDTFTIEPGCDKTSGPGGCGKFSNIVNFRGYKDLPGPQAVLNYPDAPE
jgi:uncharacterized phage protein (TIGR02218 family)